MSDFLTVLCVIRHSGTVADGVFDEIAATGIRPDDVVFLSVTDGVSIEAVESGADVSSWDEDDGMDDEEVYDHSRAKEDARNLHWECEVHDCQAAARPCRCGAAHCPDHPHLNIRTR